MQTSDPESDMAGILELSDRAFKIAKINMLRNLMQKVDNMDDISREIKTTRKNQKEMLEI